MSDELEGSAGGSSPPGRRGAKPCRLKKITLQQHEEPA